MKTISTTLVGNITNDPKLKDAGKYKVCNFSVAVNTCEKDSEGNYITNFYEIEWFGAPTLMDRFMKDAKKGMPVFVTGASWMYSYFSKQKNMTAYGLKLRASDVTLVSRPRGASERNDDNYADI